jgi:predicted DsbA family dithiol-disulfide isomerase
VTGVPTLVLDGRPPVPAVQPPARLRLLLEDALRAVSADQTPDR